MEYMFNIHWMLRRGLSADFVPMIEDIGLDDLPPEVTIEEARAMAIEEFKETRRRKGTDKNCYYITDVCGG